MADGKVVIDVVLDDGRVVKGVANIDNRLRGLGRAGDSGSIGIGKIVTALGLVALARKGIDLVRGSLQQAFGRIDTMERFERTMTQITGSSEEVRRALEIMSDYVTGTGYTLDAAAHSVQNFVLRGLEVDEATKVIEAWGDAVAFYGDGSNESFLTVTDALGKMLTKGKVTMDQMNRIFEVGINPIQTYADATGKNVEEVEDALSKGEISAEEFVMVVSDAFLEGTANMDSIAGAAQDAGSSWGAVWDNMRTRVAIGVVNIIQSIDEMLTDNGLPDMRSMVEEFGNKFRDVLNWIAENIPNAVNRMKEIYNTLEPWIPLITTIISSVAGMVVAWSAFNSVKRIIDNVKLSFQALNLVMMKNPWLLLIGAVIALAMLIYQYWDEIKAFTLSVWGAIRDFFSEIWGAIQEKVMSVAGPLIEWLVEKFEMGKEVMLTIWEGIAEFFGAIWEVIKNIFLGALLLLINLFTGNFEEMRENASAIFENIKEALSDAWEAIKKIFNAALKWVVELLGGDFDKMKKKVDKVWNDIESIISDVWTFIKNTFKNALDFVKALVRGDFDGMKKAIQNQMANIRENLGNAWERIKKLFSDAGNRIRSIAREKFENMKQAVRNKMNEVRDRIRDGWNRARDFLRNIDLMQIGRNIIQGLIRGIRNKIADVRRAITDVTDAITGKVKSILGISSPSKWMRDMIGKNMMLGWQVGIDREKRSTIRKAEEMTGWMMPGVPKNRLRGVSLPMGNLTMASGMVGGPTTSATTHRNDNRTINISVDANNIEELQRVIELFTGLKQTVRQG